MRNITKQVVAAFVEGRPKLSGNTRTDGRTLWLHGNEIARRGTVREVEINLAGWDTSTTRDCLRGLGVWVGFQLYREGGQTWLVDGRAGRYAMPSEGWVGVVACNPEDSTEESCSRSNQTQILLDQLNDAVSVIVLSPKIRKFLTADDPKALEQCFDAFNAYRNLLAVTRLARLYVAEEAAAYGLPVTGEPCGCRRGLERDNCPNCEGTGRAIDWRAFHAAKRERAARFGRVLCICAGVDPDQVGEGGAL